MLDMTTAELNKALEAEQAKNADLINRLDAAMETNEQLLDQLGDKDRQIEKLKTEFDKLKAACETKMAEAETTITQLKKRIDGQAHTIGVLEDKLDNAEQNYRTVCEQVDAQMSDNIRLQFQRDTWKQVAKWLIKQVGGGNA